MKTITVAALRSKMKYYFDVVSTSMNVIVIPKSNDDDAVVIMSLRAYNSLKETEYLLSHPNNRTRLSESIKQLEDGETKSFDLEMIKK